MDREVGDALERAVAHCWPRPQLRWDSRTGDLPVGVQIVGPYLEDRTPLRFAVGPEEILGGFTPPPSCV